MEYSSAGELALSAAGWTPERLVSIKLWVARLVAEGYTLSDAADRLLRNLGGLTIHLPANPPRNPYPHNLVFDPIYYGSGERDRVEEWERSLGVSLFPVGYVTGAYAIWVADTGAVYYGIEFGLYSLGASFAEALQRLLSADFDSTPVVPGGP